MLSGPDKSARRIFALAISSEMLLSPFIASSLVAYRSVWVLPPYFGSDTANAWAPCITVAVSRWVSRCFPWVTSLDGLARCGVTVSDDVPGASTGAENCIGVVRGGRGPSWMCDETRGSHGRAGQHRRCRGGRRAGGCPGQGGPGPGAGAAAQRGDRVGVRDRAVAGNAGELLGDRGSGRS